MTSSVTRSSRSSNKKALPATTDNIISKAKSSTLKKKKQRISKRDTDLENRSKKQQQQQQQNQQQQQQSKDDESLTSGKIDASEHPEYIRLMSQLDQSKNERLQKMENWRNFELQCIHDWFAAQKKQAWDDFYFARKKVRSDLAHDVQQKITRLKQELAHLNKQSKTQLTEAQQEYEYVDWVPPERLYAIGSFVGGASNEEVDRDLAIARQPYNGSNTPNLVYSDYESRSTSHSAEDERAVSPARTETASSSSVTSEQYHHLNHNHSHNQYQHQYTFETQQNHHQIHHPANSSTSYTTNNNNVIYPPYEFEEIPQERSRDWWPYRSTTTA